MSCAGVVIGASAGGIAAVCEVLRQIPVPPPFPRFLALHLPQQGHFDWEQIFGSFLPTAQAEEKLRPQPGHLYVAPPGYHLLIERDLSLSLSNDEPVNWARPSIDVLFESAAAAFQASLTGIILTGANHDGAAGLRMIKERGGITVVQDPSCAEVASMPRAALRATAADHVLNLKAIGQLLANLSLEGKAHAV